MDIFWKLLEKSVIISGTIALGVVFVMCYCAVAGIETPDAFTLAFGIIVGFFFSEKASKAQMDNRKEG